MTILRDLILYGDRIIYLETGPVELEIKGRNIIIFFNVLLLGKDKTVLGMPFLQEYNPKIDWMEQTIEMTCCPCTCHQWQSKQSDREN